MTSKLIFDADRAASIALNKPTVSSLAVLGEISIAGTMIKVDSWQTPFKCALTAGRRKYYCLLHQPQTLVLYPQN